jgi:hypothetical protein
MSNVIAMIALFRIAETPDCRDHHSIWSGGCRAVL